MVILVNIEHRFLSRTPKEVSKGKWLIPSWFDLDTF